MYVGLILFLFYSSLKYFVICYMKLSFIFELKQVVIDQVMAATKVVIPRTPQSTSSLTLLYF